LVSGRTLLGAGLAVIAIVALTTLVIVQQTALQNVLGQSPATTVYIIPPVGITFSTFTSSSLSSTSTSSSAPENTTTTPYVSVGYGVHVYSSLEGRMPSQGAVFLALTLVVENHGYDRVSVNPLDFYVILVNTQYPPSPLPLSDGLTSTDVLNGKSVSGSLIYAVPSNYSNFTLLWLPPSDLNVQYYALNQTFTNTP
jgi:hypothetical protein